MKYRTMSVPGSLPKVYCLQKFENGSWNPVVNDKGELLTFRSWIDANDWARNNSRRWWEFWK